MDRTLNNAVRFQLAQLLGEHLLRDAGDALLQVREAQHLAVKKVEKDEQLPSAFQQAQAGLGVDGCRQRRVLFAAFGSQRLTFWCVLAIT